MTTSAAQSATGREQRRHERYPVSLDATITAGRRTLSGRVSDASFGGLFLCLDEPPALRNLVRINLVLPSDSLPIELLGMAVYVLRPQDAKGRAPGCGVQFFGIDQDTRERWEKYIGRLRAARGAPAPARTPPPAAGPAPVRTPKPELRLHARSVEALQVALFASPDGFVRMRSPLVLMPATQLSLVLVHPESQRQLAVPAAVVNSDGTRLSLRLLDQEKRRAEIMRFLDDDFHITVDLELSVDLSGTG